MIAHFKPYGEKKETIREQNILFTKPYNLT